MLVSPAFILVCLQFIDGDIAGNQAAGYLGGFFASAAVENPSPFFEIA
jgi:hypothetical protein